MSKRRIDYIALFLAIVCLLLALSFGVRGVVTEGTTQLAIAIALGTASNYWADKARCA